MSRKKQSRRVREKGQHEHRPGAGRSQATLGTREVRMAGGEYKGELGVGEVSRQGPC